MKKLKYYYGCIQWLWQNREWKSTRQKWKAMDREVKKNDNSRTI